MGKKSFLKATSNEKKLFRSILAKNPPYNDKYFCPIVLKAILIYRER